MAPLQGDVESIAQPDIIVEDEMVGMVKEVTLVEKSTGEG